CARLRPYTYSYEGNVFDFW
nr:immunoglobulin heavy chain junction region [Macaca mulatta]